MALKRELLQVMLSGLIRLTTQSIAGVSYMDHFDFEERYRDPYECDPFYYYPLHLPPHCAKMYEELIGTGVSSLTNSPVRVVKESEVLYNAYPSLGSSQPVYNLDTSNSQEMYEMSPLTPYLKMFQMLRQDVMREPSAPTLANIPGLGVVALYNQPISRKSGHYIKKIAGIYRDANINYNQYYGNGIESETTTNNSDVAKGEKKESVNQKEHKDKFDIQTKIEIGNIIAKLRSIKN